MEQTNEKAWLDETDQSQGSKLTKSTNLKMHNMDNVSGLPTNIKIGSNNRKGYFENPFSDTNTPLF